MKRDDKLFFVLNFFIWTLIYGISFYQATHVPKIKTEISSTLPHMTVEGNDRSDNVSELAEEGKISPENSDYDESSEGETLSMLKETLAGTYVSKSGYCFYFGQGGYYSGFFDSEHTDVEDGSYDITEESNLVTIKIISSDKQRIVSYRLQMNGPKNYTLIYEPTDFKIELEKKDE